MDTFKKTLFRKAFLVLAALGIIGGGIVGGFYLKGKTVLPFWVILIIIGVYLAVSGFTFFYFVSRPFSLIMKEVKAVLTGDKYNKIYTKRIDEFGIFSHFFNEAVLSLEQVKKDIKEGKRMSSELDIVQEIQRSILPKAIPSLPKFDVIAKTRPATEVGGDSFDFIQNNNKHFVYIGDVTGHGAPAGVIMLMVNALIHVFAEKFDTAREILINVNRILKPRIRTTMFMTLVMLEWDNAQQKLTYTGAGHENVLVYRASQGICEINQTGGIALGMVDDNTQILQEKPISLAPGDTVVLYTDGVTEAKNSAGEQFGLERLKAAIEKNAAAGTIDDIFKKIASDYAAFCEEEVQEDDVTLIVARYTGIDTQKGLTSTQW